MVKILGAVMVIAACTLLGLSKSAALRARVRNLNAIVAALELMRGEVCVKKASLPEIAEALAETGPKETREFFARLGRSMKRLGEKTFSEIWMETVESSVELGLQEEEVTTLDLLGLSLGRYDVTEQGGAITGCAERMRGYAVKAAEESSREGRLWTGLGAAGGLIIAILLI